MRADDTRGHAFDTFAKLGDIRGESTDKDHKDWIEIESWSFGALLGSPRR
ncbi:MAG: type VI secretion system tube protein Hcp [Dehalococcoidia bacterium]